MAFYIFGNDGKLFFNNILFIMLLEVKKKRTDLNGKVERFNLIIYEKPALTFFILHE